MAEQNDHDAKGVLVEERMYTPDGKVTSGAIYKDGKLLDVWYGGPKPTNLRR